MQKDEPYDRLEVNRLLSDLFPSTYMNEKLKQLESASTKKPKAKSASKSNEPDPDDAIVNAIIENAFSGNDSPAPLSLSPPTTPPPSGAVTTPKAPMAPKKPVAKKKEKQNFNIIIHVEPKTKSQGQGAASDENAISKRLDFGAKKGTRDPVREPEINDDDDDSDEDYIPEDSDEEEYYEDEDDDE